MATSKKELIAKLKELATQELKVKKGTDCDIIIEWNFYSKYAGLFGASVRKKRYTLKLVFDEKTKEINYSDLLTDSGIESGSATAFIRKEKTNGLLINTKQQEKRFGKKESGVGLIYDYKLDPMLIKQKVFEIAKRNKWKMVM